MGALTRRRAARWGPAAVLLLILAGACDDAFAPGADRVRVVFQPRFAEGDAGTDNPALRVDRVRVVLTDAAGDTVVDQTVLWPLDQDTLRLEVAVTVTGTDEFTFRLEGREGDLVLFDTGPQPLLLNASQGGSAAVVTPVLEYAGPESRLETVSITGAPSFLAAGGTVDLDALGSDGDGGTVSDPLVAWSSLDTLAAVVDTAGVVTARHRVGRTATIVARVAFRTLSDTVVIPIEPAAVEVSLAADTINALGFTTRATAVQLGTAGPVTGGAITWSTSDTTVLRIIGSSRDTLVVSGRAVGSAWVRASSGPTTDSAMVTVRQVVSAVAVVPTRALFAVGATLGLSAVAVDSGGSVVPDAAVTWTSGTAAATVGSDGTATGAADGSGVLTATVDGVSGSTRVEVGGAAAAAAIGDFHACRLDSTGAAFCWGENEFGQLGDGTTTASTSPVAVAGGHTFTALAAGGNHTCGIADDGTTWCWGGNGFGQLGDGTTTHRSTPVAAAVPALTSVTAGGRHACGLDAAGQAYCWGLNEYGQLGDGTAGTNVVATPQPAATGLAFAGLSAGWLHTCGVTAAGSAHCWGRGTEGQLGHGIAGDTAQPATVDGGHVFASLAAGAAHTCGTTAAGAALCWGYNSSGQLGTGSLEGASTPTAVGGGHTFSALAAGWIHSCGVNTAGAIYCWGSNAALELGQGSPRASRTPLAVDLGVDGDALAAGGRRTCVTASGALLCWGGIPPELLGRATLVVPDPGPPVGTSARR